MWAMKLTSFESTNRLVKEAFAVVSLKAKSVGPLLYL